MEGGLSGIISAIANGFCAGVLDSDASRKAARFVRFLCIVFNIPLSPCWDVPGFLPGKRLRKWRLDQGMGQKLLFVYAEGHGSKNPRFITRKAYGGAMM